MLSGANAQIAGPGPITFGADQVVQGQGNIGTNTTTIINNGLIDANVAASSLSIDPAATAVALTNNGTIQASGGGILIFTGNAGGALINTAYLQATGAGSEFRLTSTANVSGGTLNAINGGLFRLVAVQTATLADLTNTGTFISDNNTDTNVSGTITNNGTITIASTVRHNAHLVNTAVTFSGNGPVVLNGPLDQIAGGGTLTNGAAHTIQGQGNIGANSISIINNGLIDADVTGQTLSSIDPRRQGT